jgi:hypothetical protein
VLAEPDLFFPKQMSEIYNPLLKSLVWGSGWLVWYWMNIRF